MKGGQTPIHFMRWSPADYVNDPWVKLAASRNDTGALAVYHLFLMHSFMEGGRLPSDPELLASVLGLDAKTVTKALAFWSAPKCGLILIKDGRACNPRVLRDVAQELRFRRKQALLGKEGGEAKARSRQALGKPKGSPSPPSPSGKRAARTSADPPPAAGAPWVDHDPGNDLEARLVKRCEELAERVAFQSGGGPNGDEDRLDVLSAVTTTPKGKSLTTLRGASRAWLEQSLRACDDFERDLGEPPAVAPAEEA